MSRNHALSAELRVHIEKTPSALRREVQSRVEMRMGVELIGIPRLAYGSMGERRWDTLKLPTSSVSRNSQTTSVECCLLRNYGTLTRVCSRQRREQDHRYRSSAWRVLQL